VSVLPSRGAFLELGPLIHLEKPFTLAALSAAIERALEPALSLS
jgi:hypothetical protein